MSIDETLNKLQEALLADLAKEEENRDKKANAQESEKLAKNEALIKRIDRNKELFYRFDNIFRNIIDSSNNKSKKVEELKKLIGQIDELIQIRVHAPFRDDLEFLNSLQYLKKHVSEYKLNLELPSPQSESVSEDLDTFKDYNKPNLTRSQIIFIMSALKRAKITLSDLSDTDLAKAFHILTGLSENKLRQQLSAYKNNEIEYTEQDKNTLKDTLEKITKAIDQLPSKNK